jgi:hypothetical protein
VSISRNAAASGCLLLFISGVIMHSKVVVSQEVSSVKVAWFASTLLNEISQAKAYPRPPTPSQGALPPTQLAPRIDRLRPAAALCSPGR